MTAFRGLTYEIQCSPVLDAAGTGVGIFGLVRDVTETQLARQQLEFMAHHDLLTSLPNRVLFNDRLQEALHRA
ncbi:diguanylate cyclase/phosphodiesterase with PAS/PAC sensor(s), partial [mine drainage metagenome]